jgi:hypothetical protein
VPTININTILKANPRDGKRGAPLGMPNVFPKEPTRERIYCQHVRFVDDCYSLDGTYWGAPANLWCLFTESQSLRAFVRANNRRDALRAFYALPGNPFKPPVLARWRLADAAGAPVTHR